MSSRFIKPSSVLVTTISGEKLPREACRLINKKFYKIGKKNLENSGDVYRITSRTTKIKKWYRSETGYLVYDHRQQTYMLRTDLQVIVENGIVGFDDDNRPIFGTFSQNPDAPSTIEVFFEGKIYICLNKEVLVNNSNFQEAISDGIYYERGHLPALLFTEPLGCSAEYKNSLNYDSKGKTQQFVDLFDINFKSPIYPQVSENYKLLHDLTFGVEFETTKGKLSETITNSLGLIPLRDGSISGLEYVTIPHSGERGMQALIETTLQLEKRTRYDKNCSLHIHVGNIPRTEEFFVALYKVLFRIQEEMYDLFPYHKFKNFGVKKKHYTKPLPINTFLKLDSKIDSSNIRTNFEHVFKFLSMGQSYKNYDYKLDNIKTHPSDPQGTQKWNIRTRYYWVNLIPLLFGNRQTIEFRIHTPTHDTNKVINYLILCTSIIEFTKTNTDGILKNGATLANLTLSDLLLMTVGRKNNNIASEVTRYLDHRKDFITRCTGSGDLIADETKFIYKPRYMDWSKPTSKKELDEFPGGNLYRSKKMVTTAFDEGPGIITGFDDLGHPILM